MSCRSAFPERGVWRPGTAFGSDSVLDVRPASVEKTQLFVYCKDGSAVTGQDLNGAVIVGTGPDGKRDAFRIDKIVRNPDDAVGETFLYTFSVLPPGSSQWVPMCNADYKGVSAGFPLTGSWDEQGTHLKTQNFSIACTSGAIGKCVRYGYKPWGKAKDGREMWDYHQACVRMMRADYCGDGKGQTRDGTHIDVIEKLGVLNEYSSELNFEAAWTPEGATCVAKPRLSPSPWSLESITQECPEKLKDRTGIDACRFDKEESNPTVLFLNRS